LQQINCKSLTYSTVENCVRCLLLCFGVLLLAKRIRPVIGDRDQGKSDPHLSSYGHVFVSADGSWGGGGAVGKGVFLGTCDSGSPFRASNSESTAEVLNYF
jgi:hypothetical protein